MRHIVVKAIVVAALSIGMPLQASAARLPVIAESGPRGVVVRWIPSAAGAHVATIVRVASNAASSAPIIVRRPANAPEARAMGVQEFPPGALNTAAFNAKIDAAPFQAAFASLTTLDLALIRGDAYIDRVANRGATYQYKVTLDDGESGVSPSVRAGELPNPSSLAITYFTATGTDRMNVLAFRAPAGIGIVDVYRSSGGGFTKIAVATANSGVAHYQDRVIAGVRYGYRIAVVDAADNVGPMSSTEFAVAKDLHRAAPPRNVRASESHNALLLTWSPSPDADVAAYEIYRGPDDKHLSRVARVSAAMRSYLDHPQIGVLYTYSVLARNRAGNPGIQGAVVFGEVAKRQPPDAPAHLTAQPEQAGVLLSWSASHDPTTAYYEIYRRTPDHKSIRFGSVRASQRTFSVKLALQQMAAFAYGVGAQDRFGNRSMPFVWVIAKAIRTNVSDAMAPVSVRYAHGVMEVGIFPLEDPDVQAQRIYRSVNRGPVVLLASVKPDFQLYRDVRVRPGQLYGYAIAAVQTNGKEGKRSNVVSYFIPAAQPQPPALSARMLSDGRTVELHWPRAGGLIGYVVLRRSPGGSVVVVAALVRAFAYRDVLPAGATGTFAYAVKLMLPSGPTNAGPFTSIHAVSSK
jgi:fibronectin type 3 domain-containing protein